ncbi:MAG: terminase small subunit [Steroidobacteraceae bacterium]|jgi:phage terminase small subunit
MSSTRNPRASDQRRERFIRYFPGSSSATEAAIKAGYSAKSAHVAASRLLKIDKVRAAIDAANLAAAQACGITRERTLQELGRVAYSDVRALLDADGNVKPIHALSLDEAAQIAGIEVETVVEREEGDDETSGTVTTTTVKKIRRWDKVRALQAAIGVLGLNKQADPAAGTARLAITIVPWDKNRPLARRSDLQASVPTVHVFGEDDR